MAKHKEEPVAQTPEELLVEEQTASPVEDESYASFFSAEMKNAERVVGRSNILEGNELAESKVGIEVPSLALQYLLCHDSMILGQYYALAGKKASNKSSFAYEVSRWIMERSGFARLYDTENLKISDTLVYGMLGHVINTRSWKIVTCEFLDQWVSMVREFIDNYRNTFGIGRPVKAREKLPPLLPFALIIDSLTGSTTEDNTEKALQGKQTNTQGMQTAREIQTWMQSQKLLHVPCLLLMIRHLKQGVEVGGMPGRGPSDKTPGGTAPDYYAATDLRFALIGKNQLARMGYNEIKMTTAKNSLGEDKRSIVVRFSWQYGEGEGEVRVQPRWEWDLATADFLAEFEGRKDELHDICHVVKGGTKSEPRFSCKALGLRDVTGDDLGMAVRLDEKLYHQLQDFFHISRVRQFGQ